MRYRFLAGALALAAVLIAACGGDSGTVPDDGGMPAMEQATPEGNTADEEGSDAGGDAGNGPTMALFEGIDGCTVLSTTVTCSRVDLNGFDLSGLDLSFFDFISSDLSGINLAGATLVGTVLNGSDLSGANLSGANLTAADLRGTDLADTNLTGTNLSEAHLGGATYPWSDERESGLEGATFCNTRLTSMEVSDRDC